MTAQDWVIIIGAVAILINGAISSFFAAKSAFLAARNVKLAEKAVVNQWATL